MKLFNQSGTSPFKRHLLFLIATAVTVPFVGYHFGTFDEAMHIPFLKYMADPALYPGDPMLSLHSIYYSFFWYAFIPVLRMGWLEPVLFILHCCTTYLTFWAVWELSQTLFHDDLAALLSVIVFIFPHFGFVGFPVFEMAPLSRTFVLPFMLIAVNQFLKGRVPLAFLIAGLMYNIHVVSVNFILAMFGLACVLEFRRIGWKKISLGAVLFLLAALPVLMWKANSTPVDFTLRQEWVDFLNLTSFRQIFAMVGPHPGLWVLTLGGISTLVMFFIAIPRQLQPVDRTVRNFVFACMVVLVVHVITVNFLAVTIIIQSQIGRIGLWSLILSHLYFAGYLARAYRDKDMPVHAFWALLIAFIFSPSPLMTLGVWLFIWYARRTQRQERILKVAAYGMPLVVLVAYVSISSLGLWMPGIYIYGKLTPWVDVQNWARISTPKEARFITPPEKWQVQESDWRVHSERASAATLSELLVAAFQPGYEVEWKTRFEMVAPGALERFNGDFFKTYEITKEAYYTLDTDALLKAACRMDAQYIVVEKPHLHDLPEVYENTEYVIYDVEGKACK